MSLLILLLPLLLLIRPAHVTGFPDAFHRPLPELLLLLLLPELLLLQLPLLLLLPLLLIFLAHVAGQCSPSAPITSPAAP